MSPVSQDDPPDRLEAETAEFRQVLAKGRSANQLALFDLLVERSKDMRSPKEVEIALALFGANAIHDATADSGVRVYVHRLRKRIEDHYAGKTGSRLFIPKGEYRIVLEEAGEALNRPSRLASAASLISANPALSFGLSLIVLAGLAFASWQTFSTRLPQQSAAALDRQALFGAGAALSDPIVAVGDSLLLAETEDQHSVRRMILHPAIRTRDDFGRYMKDHPEVFYRLYDFNLNFAPLQAVEAAWLAQDDIPTGSHGARAGMMPVSALNGAQIKAHDIVFVGRLSQLGLLESAVFAQSRLRLVAYDRLVDTVGGTTFKGQVYTSDAAHPGSDIGYLAITTGPTGRRLVVMAGLGDRGASAMADMLDAPQELAALKKRLGSSRNFEAVYQVQTLPGRPSERRLIATYPRP
ncbi:MAG: hypothetical protein ABIQ66_03400 [Novosphingobium sp.]